MSPDTCIEYITPPTGQNVARFDHCPGFSGRQSLLPIEPICWFCKFAAFDLFSDKLPENGICHHHMDSLSAEK